MQDKSIRKIAPFIEFTNHGISAFLLRDNKSQHIILSFYFLFFSLFTRKCYLILYNRFFARFFVCTSEQLFLNILISTDAVYSGINY